GKHSSCPQSHLLCPCDPPSIDHAQSIFQLPPLSGFKLNTVAGIARRLACSSSSSHPRSSWRFASYHQVGLITKTTASCSAKTVIDLSPLIKTVEVSV